MKVKRIAYLLCLCCCMSIAAPPAVLADEELDEIADQYNRNISNKRYKVVCKMEAPIGSRIKRKVCRTVATIDRSRTEARRTMDRLRTSVSKNPGGGW